MIDKELAERIRQAVYDAKATAALAQTQVENLHGLLIEASAKATIPGAARIRSRIEMADDHAQDLAAALSSMHRLIGLAAPAFGYEATPPNELMGRAAPMPLARMPAE